MSSWTRAPPTTLADCPIGLFLKGDTLALKTEYGNNEGRIDAYIVSSGEFFWGGTSVPKEQRMVMVEPVEWSGPIPRPDSEAEVCVCGNCPDCYAAMSAESAPVCDAKFCPEPDSADPCSDCTPQPGEPRGESVLELVQRAHKNPMTLSTEEVRRLATAAGRGHGLDKEPSDESGEEG